MITAEEARKKINKDDKKQFEIELRNVGKKIYEACELNKDNCSFVVPHRYVNDVRDVLVEKGYFVINKGNEFTISW